MDDRSTQIMAEPREKKEEGRVCKEESAGGK
jgi:hypothetical protein